MHPAIMQRRPHPRDTRQSSGRTPGPPGLASRTVHATRLSAGGTLSYDDPRLDTGRRPAMTGQPSAPPLPVMAHSPAR